MKSILTRKGFNNFMKPLCKNVKRGSRPVVKLINIVLLHISDVYDSPLISHATESPVVHRLMIQEPGPRRRGTGSGIYCETGNLLDSPHLL